MPATKANTVIGVDYSGVSNSGVTVRLGCKTGRGNLTLRQADEALCGKRLTVRLLARSSGGSGQDSLPGMDQDITVRAVADVKGFGVTPKNFTFGLSFMVSDIGPEKLALLDQFPKRAGTITITGVEELPEDDKNGEGDE